MNFLMNGKYFGFPLGAIDFIKLPLDYSLSFVKAAIRKKSTDKSFKSNIKSRMGTKIYHGFFAPYINKKIGCLNGGKDLHEDWWLRAKRDYKNEIIRAKNVRETKSEGERDLIENIINILFKALKPKDKIFYPRKGIEVIPNKLWEAYRKFGGQTICNVNDIKLLSSNDRINKIVVNNNQYNVKNLIWTARVPELCNMFLGSAYD